MIWWENNFFYLSSNFVRVEFEWVSGLTWNHPINEKIEEQFLKVIKLLKIVTIKQTVFFFISLGELSFPKNQKKKKCVSLPSPKTNKLRIQFSFWTNRSLFSWFFFSPKSPKVKAVVLWKKNVLLKVRKMISETITWESWVFQKVINETISRDFWAF